MAEQNPPKKPDSGFVMISLIIVLAIIAILAAMRFGKSGNSQKSVQQTGNEAIEQTKRNNSLLKQQQDEIQIQNNLNSIGN